MMSFAPIPNVPGAVGATVTLQNGQVGVLFDQMQRLGALYMLDSRTMHSAHSDVTVDNLRAVMGLMSDLIDALQAPPPAAA